MHARNWLGLVLLLLTLTGAPAWAAAPTGIQGSWIGWASWLVDGQGPDCDASMQFRESEGEFRLLGGYLECGVVALETGPQTFVKVGDELRQDGVTVGRWDPNHYEWRTPYGEEGVMIESKVNLDGSHFDYTEAWRRADGSLLYWIEGRLFRRQQ